MKIDLKTCSEKELWHYVAVHLKKNGIDTVLVGGSVVSVYTDGAYQSGDLDFVRLDMFTVGIKEAMMNSVLKNMADIIFIPNANIYLSSFLVAHLWGLVKIMKLLLMKLKSMVKLLKFIRLQIV